MPTSFINQLLIQVCLVFVLTTFLYVKQGFRKVDPDRWEFANEGFLRDQKHLLKGITRRKSMHGQQVHQQPTQSHHRHGSSSLGACVEVGKFGLEEEIECLKRDKNVLMQELVRLRQQQQGTDNQLQTMVNRLHGMEQRQQQMMSFLAKAVQSPGFLSQFVQQKNESNRRISEVNKKRRLQQEGGGEPTAPPLDGQIIKYDPLLNDTTKMLRQLMKADKSIHSSSSSCDGGCLFLSNNSSSSLPGLDSSSSTSRVSGVTLQEVVPPTSGQLASELQCCADQFPQSVLGGSPKIKEADSVMHELALGDEAFMEADMCADMMEGISSDYSTLWEDLDLLVESPSFPPEVESADSLLLCDDSKANDTTEDRT